MIEISVPQDHLCHHSASLVMPNGDPSDKFFYPTLRLIINSYNLSYFTSDLDCACGKLHLNKGLVFHIYLLPMLLAPVINSKITLLAKVLIFYFMLWYSLKQVRVKL